MCLLPVNLDEDAQFTPSPPIWISDDVSRSIQLAMKWQPMPARAFEPSGTFVEVLCGHPEQKYGVRVAPATAIERCASGMSAAARAARSRPGKIGSSRFARMPASPRGDNSPTQG